jgi:hypothetical protein
MKTCREKCSNAQGSYLPQTTKSITPQVLAMFTGKSEKVVGDDRLQKRNQFKIALKNNLQKKKR